MDAPLTRRSVLNAGGVIFGSGLLGVQAQATPDGDSGRYIVGTSSNVARRAARRQAASVHRELDFGPIGGAVAGNFPESAREALRDRPGVRYVEPDATLDLLGQTVDEGVERIGALDAHADGASGEGAHVSIIDTGVESTHETLAENLGEGYAPVPCDECEEDWGDTHGHGTGVAGVVGAADNGVGTLGVAPDCTLHAARVMDGDTGAYVSDIAAALEWTADQGYDVANMSLGADIVSTTLENACQYAYDRGVLLVSSAGNQGEEDSVTVPAAYETVVAVSAVTDDDDLAWFSSMGPEVELTAPGVAITVPDIDDEYSARSGTSFAGPHVAGAAALVMADGTTRSETRGRLVETAEDLGLDEEEQGHGLVRADRAVDESDDDGGDDSDDDGGDDSDDEDDGDDGDDDVTALAVETGGTTDVDDSSATLTGELAELEGHDTATVSFEWGESGGGLSNTTDEQTLDTTDEFSDEVTGLDDDTEYAFRAVADAGDDADAGETRTFTTEGVDDGDDGDGDDGDDGDDDDGDGGDDDDEIGAEPEIDEFELQERNAGPWTRVRVHWTVSHDDGALETVETVVDGMGTETTSVSGDEDNGHHDHRERNGGGTYEVTLTVTDTEGNETSDTASVDL